MKNVFKVPKALFLGIFLIVLSIGIYAVYGCFDYVNRCVSITPRDNIKAVEMNKLYSIEDFFLIEREKDTGNRVIDIIWEGGSHENICVMENGLFRVTGGTGYLCIYLEDWNNDSPERSYKDIKLPVVSGTA